MDITIFPDLKDANKATGLAVVIDVFRAFSVEVYIFENGAKHIVPVMTLEEAYELKRLHPDYILVGERGGIKPDGFDFGNSPSELLGADFTDKVIVHATSNGTRGLLMVTNADEILTGSFVNVGAIIRYIKTISPSTVSLVSTSHRSDEMNEDMILAQYIRDALEGKKTSPNEIVEMMKKTSVYAFLFDEISVPPDDFNLCMDIDRTNFVIRKEYSDGKVMLMKKVIDIVDLDFHELFDDEITPEMRREVEKSRKKPISDFINI